MGKWSKLPVDLLNVIEDHVVLYIDKVRIRAVSLEWYSYLPKLPDHRAKRIPFLLHPLENDKEATHGLLNPLDNKVYKIYVPEARVKLFKGSSYGWIVTVEDFHSSSRIDMYLINPITRAQFKLPPRTEFADVVRYCPDKIGREFVVRMWFDDDNDDDDEEFIDETIVSEYNYNMSLGMTMKVVLSSAPDNEECVVVAIYGQAHQLAWCRCNNKKWTHIYTGLSGFNDILYSNNYMYALTHRGEVFMFENIGTELDIKFKVVATRIPVARGRSAYLAECSDGSLVVVVRHYDFESNPHPTHTMGFKVYKLDNKSNSSWIEVKSIGDDVLFVGFGSVRSISSSDFEGFKGNHIYFSDAEHGLATFEKNKNQESDVGVFNLKDGTVELFPGLDERIWPRPIWINVR